MQNLINLLMLLILSIKYKMGKIRLEDVKNNQEKLKSYHEEIKKKTKNIDQKSKKHFVQY